MDTLGYLIKRFFAFGVDWYLSSVLINLTANALEHFAPQNENGVYLSLLIVSVIVSFFYFVLIPAKVWKGQTPLMKLLQLKIVSQDGKNPKLGALFLRYFVGCLIFEGTFYIPSVNIRTVMILMILKNHEMLSQVIVWMITISSILGLVIALLDRRKEFRFIHDRISYTKVTETSKVS